MKKILNVLVLSLISTCFFGQVPNSFKYQAVLRDTTGKLKTNTTAKIEISILKGSSSGNAVYTEVIDTVTNAFGVVNLEIGSKNASTFSKVDWAKGPYFIQIKVDNIVISATQLLSVPYAKYAEKAGSANEDSLILKDSSGERYIIKVNTSGQLRTTKIISDSTFVAYYPFDGDASDASGFGNNGIVNGAQLTSDRHGNANSAYYFNGNNNFIDIGNNSSIKRFQSNFSVSFWINLKAYSPDYCSIVLSNRSKLTSKFSGSMIEIAGGLSKEFKQVIFYKNYSTTDDTLSAGYLNSIKQLDLNTWYFVCMTYQYNGGSNNIVKSYINGELTATKKLSATIDPENSSTFIGCESELSPVDYSLNGSLDDIRIYKRVLSSDDITKLYLNNK
jgi:hypothetical protein